MQLISASVPKRKAPAGAASGQNELFFMDAAGAVREWSSRFAGGKLALVSDAPRFAVFRAFALSPRAISLILEEDALPLFSLPEGVSCVMAAGGEEVLAAARCFAEVRRLPCLLLPADAALEGAREERAPVLIGGERALHRLAPAAVCCDRALLISSLGEGYSALLLARLASFEGRALAALGVGECASAAFLPAPALPEPAFEPVLRALFSLPRELMRGEGFTLASLLKEDGEGAPRRRAYAQLSALYAAFFFKGHPRRTFVPDYARRAALAGTPFAAAVPSPEEYAARALALERIRGTFSAEALRFLEERPQEEARIAALSAAAAAQEKARPSPAAAQEKARPSPALLGGGDTFRLKYLPEHAPHGLSAVIRDFGLMEWQF